MFTMQSEAASSKIDAAVDRYEKHFKESFPLYEYIEVTSGDGFDFSERGAIRLEKAIDNLMKRNIKADKPADYDDRTY